MIDEEYFIGRDHAEYEQIHQLLDYFEEIWVGRPNNRGEGRTKPRFPVPFWNIFEMATEGRSTTNNAVEGWHNGIRYSIRKRPQFSEFVDFLKDESRLSATRADEVYRNNASSQRHLAAKLKTWLLATKCSPTN